MISSTVLLLDREQILIAPGHNPRTEISDAELNELTASIRSRGLLQPLRVRPVNEADGVADNGLPKYMLVAGERRLTAIDALGADYDEPIPVALTQLEDEHELRIDAIVENVQRVDLNPVEEALAYQGLVAGGWTPKGVAEQIGVAQARVTKRLEILTLPEYCVEQLRKERLPISCVKSLKSMAAVAAELAVRAATRCGGKPQWAATLAKDPDRIVQMLAQDPKEPFWATNSQWAPQDVTQLGKSADHKELAARMNTWGEERWHQLLTLRAAHFAEAVSRLYQPDGNLSPIATDATDVLVALSKAADEKEQDIAARRKAAVESKLRSGEVKPDQTVAEAEAEAKARAAERERELEQRKQSRGYNLQVGALIKTDLARMELTRPVAIAISSVMLDHQDLGRVGKAGLRYVFEELQKETRKKPKNGGPEKVKVDYLGNYGECKKAIHAWVAGASTPEEILGRTLSVYIAAELADNRVVSQSQRDGERQVGHHMAMLEIAAAVAPEALQTPIKQRMTAIAKQQTDVAEAVIARAHERDEHESALAQALDEDEAEYIERENEANFPEGESE